MGSAHPWTAAFATSLLLFSAFQSVAAQRTGDRVRVVIAGDTLTGDVTERRETGFTMALRVGFASDLELERDVEYAQVENLEVRTCCIDYAWVYATLAGSLVGALVGEATNEEVCAETSFLFIFEDFHCEKVGNNEILGGLIGGAAGLVVGLFGLHDRWETISQPGLGSLSLAPSVGVRSGYGGTTMMLGARIRF